MTRSEALQEFSTREELEMAGIAFVMATTGCDKESAKISIRAMMHYSPVYYRGGWVIPGFGYSVERIGRYVSTEHAGNPEFVGSKELIQ